MEFASELLKEARDEITARNHYVALAERLRAAGYDEEANKVASMAADENGHADILMVMSQQPIGEIILSGHMMEIPITEHHMNRPFPRTDGEWIDLSLNIKEKLTEFDPVRTEVNLHIGVVAGLDEGNEEESKRWLMQKAGELGVK